ncbi:hypothetical protein GMST_19010 [Geomonas silvestris]|uniref:Response regulatory domain-containing protein n=1 Tax=Geomonas silvestris TaxID=2740184 RepID=A0A6V8MHW0_9BACT|nr:response regulator transcription factor [Geomonas silvestris]GFO59576.1 hypothetical protein GMST_19010 [Geomonas silvestris]
MAIKILVVDDREMIRTQLSQFLGDYPEFCVVGVAGDGAEAVARTAELAPDLVLMDVSMPGMDGIEATRLITERLPRVKVVMLTLYTSAENCERALRAGAAGYLLKDNVVEEVVDAIKAVMTGKTFFSPALEPIDFGSGPI